MPVIGLYGSFVIREWLFFRPSIEYFSISTGDLSGKMTDARATVDWFFTERWGVGLGLNRVVLDLTSKPPGTIEWE